LARLGGDLPDDPGRRWIAGGAHGRFGKLAARAGRSRSIVTMSRVAKRWSYSFIIGLALFVVCLAYIPHWRSYAPHISESIPRSPYLTPWTVVSVTTLGLALACIAAPFRSPHPIQIIISKSLALVVLCFGAVFLLEYACGLRVPDLDIFFLPSLSGQRVTQYSARPTPHSATTSLLFAVAFLLFNRDSTWRMRAFLLGVLAALTLPTLAALGYLSEFSFPPPRPPSPRVGLSVPAVILYFALGSGFLGLYRRPKSPRPDFARSHKIFGRRI
jgi:hypothetical protein